LIWINSVRGFGDMILGRIYEPKREEVTGNWRKLHDEELYNLKR
jgi:hypothetical protein